jgi:hypothetical protein
MIKLQGILAVILFWVVTLMLSPIILFGVIFVVGITAVVISGIVYDITISYLKEKRQ